MADDNFTSFVISLATTAAIHFGDLVDPATGTQPEPYLDHKTKLYQLALTEGLRSPFAPKDEVQAAKEAAEKEKERTKKKGQGDKKDTKTSSGGTNTTVNQAASTAAQGDPIPAKGTGQYGVDASNAKLYTGAGDFKLPLVNSSDPQIHGMSGEGAKDAAYQAAYRSCMRRKGF